MRKLTLLISFGASLAIAAPVFSEPDFGEIVSGIAQSFLSQEVDRGTYIEAQRLNTVDGYRNYLAQFPKGAFRINAEQSLVKLGASVNSGNPPPAGGGNQSAASVEASIGLSRMQRIQIQKQLSFVGYSTGVVDGLWGANTRSAITRWQKANKLPASGYVTAQQVRLIAQQAGSGNETITGETFSGDDPVEEKLLSLTYIERREVQSRLTSLGYRTGGVDGVFGSTTRRALAAWQWDGGLRASGYLTADQLRELRRETGG